MGVEKMYCICNAKQETLTDEHGKLLRFFYRSEAEEYQKKYLPTSIIVPKWIYDAGQDYNGND